MILFHRTTAKAARAILTRGFRDATGYYMVSFETSGAWFSDRPLDVNEGACGDTLLRVALRIGPHELRRHEWVEDGKGYRKRQLLATLVNARRRLHGGVNQVPRFAWLHVPVECPFQQIAAFLRVLLR